jgi:hypothetical protein
MRGPLAPGQHVDAVVGPPGLGVHRDRNSPSRPVFFLEGAQAAQIVIARQVAVRILVVP